MGQVDLFEITFDNTQAVYCEGDRVSGQVTIKNDEEVKYKAIYIELCGIALVHWTSVDETAIELDPDELKGDYNKEQYFHKRINLLEKDGGFLDKDPLLKCGTHTFTFDCKLPPELPSSFEGQYGQVRYLARACVERALLKSNVVTKRAFTVLSGLDLNFIPEAAVKIELCKYKQVGVCCTFGSVTCDWSVKQSGFVPGEGIWIHGAVQNESKEIVAYSRAALIMVVDYKSKKRRKKERRKIAGIDKGETLPGDVTVWQDALHIPPVPPTGLNRCRLIDVNYELEFKALIEGGSSPVYFSKDVYIGTVPMSRKEMKSCIAGMYNQPYAASLDDLNNDMVKTHADSQLSLTQIIAAASTIEPRTSPTAPCLTASTDILSSAGAGGDVQICNGYGRPPPFAPGHGEDQVDAPLLNGEARGEELLPPSAPTTHTLNKPWAGDSESDNIATDPSFESSSVIGPVNLREAADDQQSLRGEMTYHPVYTYYGTAKRKDVTKKDTSADVIVNQPAKSGNIDNTSNGCVSHTIANDVIEELSDDVKNDTLTKPLCTKERKGKEEI